VFLSIYIQPIVHWTHHR